MNVPEWIVVRDASTGECIEVRSMPSIWEVAWVIRFQNTTERPDWYFLFSSVLVVVRKALDRHVSNVLAHLSEFCM